MNSKVNTSITLFFIFGTRPEAIKLAPLIQLLKNNPLFKCIICISSQHQQLLQQALDFFQITPDYDLSIMTENQSLESITTKCIDSLTPYLKKEKPNYVVVQGDTTTTLSASLCAFYQHIPIIHIEAGLRTHNPHNPFPEEMNRKLISNLATYHFAPTEKNKQDLIKEGITKNIWVVGNTVIDALSTTYSALPTESPINSIHVDNTKNMILVTGHRRENKGIPFKNLCDNLIALSKNPNNHIIFPLHLAPENKVIAHSRLSNIPNIQLIDPQPYPNFVWLMKQATLIITDSGGIQEEAPFLEKPVIVTRKTTERTEALSKNCLLIELKDFLLETTISHILNNKEKLKKLSQKCTYYGDGTTSTQIQEILERELTSQHSLIPS